MGMLSNLGNSLKKTLGLKGPSGEEIAAESQAAALKERDRLRTENAERRQETGLLQKLAKRRDVSLSFGDAERDANRTSEQRSLRSSGRFNSNRLVL